MCSQPRCQCSPLNAISTGTYSTSYFRHKSRVPCTAHQMRLSFCLALLIQLWLGAPCFANRFIPFPPNATQHHRLARSSPVPQVAAPPKRNPLQVTQFVSNPTKRTFSLFFPVPTVVSQVNTNWNSSASQSSDGNRSGSGRSLPSPPNIAWSSTNDSSIAQVPNSQMSPLPAVHFEAGEPTRTAVLDINDRTQFILNLPIPVHDHIDPIVRKILENSTAQYSHIYDNVGSTGESAANSTDGDHLFRAGRQTHQDFIKRILNAVSVDSHNVNRYVHLIRPKSRPQLLSDSTDHVDLGLPAEIADEYIDGVNPPKFPGLKVFQPLIEKTDWRHSNRPNKNPVVTVVAPAPKMPNVYSKPVINQTQSVSEKPQQQPFLPSSGPMQPKPHLAPLPAQPLPRPPQFPSPHTTSITLNDISVNNRNVFKTKLSVPSLLQSTRDNSNHDLSLLLKQEFDAKNAELNQTKAQSLAISPAGEMLVPGPIKIFSVSSQNGIEKILENITNSPPIVNPLAGPPYQLPQSPLVLMNSSLTASSTNNANMKEGVHYRPVSVTLPPPVTMLTTERPLITRHRTTSTTTKKPKNKDSVKPTEKNTFVRIRTGVRRPKPKTTTTSTTEKPPAVESTTSTPSKVPSTPVTSPKFVSTISNDVRFQVEPSNRLNETVYRPAMPSDSPDSINELELNSDESRLFNTSLDSSDLPQKNTSLIDDSVAIVPTRQSTTYRLTTERLAYILIGSCCGLAVLVLVIVAMSVRCKDMCTEYRSWKNAEKAALRWHRNNRFRNFSASHLPYPILRRSRFNLPRYFRTSIDNAKLRPPPMEPFTGPNNSPYGDTTKVLDNILNTSKPDPQACCHCINCSSTWFFRNLKHGGWCCQRGYYQPPRRTKLPFGAASSVNTFMPRFTVDNNGDIKSARYNLEMNGENGHDPNGRMQRNASEPNLDMCFNEIGNDVHGWNRGLDPRLREKASSSGAIPVKVNMSNRFFADNGAMGNPPNCRMNSGPLFCEIEDDEDDDDDDDNVEDEVTTDFSNVFETNFGEINHPQHRPRKSKLQNANCNRGSHPVGNLYHQKCFPSQPTKHKSDQINGEKSRRRQKQPPLPDYYNPLTGKYYFDSTSIKAVDHGSKAYNPNGESSSIWINSSKIVDKLHRKHGRHGAPHGDRGPQNGHRPRHHEVRPSTPGPSVGDGSDGRSHRQHRDHHGHQSRPPAHCHSHFDPGFFTRLGLPSKLTGGLDNEQNFVVWNDTSERLI